MKKEELDGGLPVPIIAVSVAAGRRALFECDRRCERPTSTLADGY